MSNLIPNCGNCKFSDFPRTLTGKVKQRRAGICRYIVPPGPPLPICITRAYDFKAEHPRRYVSADETGCPVFEAREESEAK